MTVEPRTNWPTTKMGRRLASCPGRLPLGGEQERLPDGSLTALRDMRTPEIAVEIERQARAAAFREVAERLPWALMEYDAGRITVPFDPGRAVPVGGKPRPFHRAWADALLRAILTEATGASE
jgi:hypothetical protein